jgi:hypothetical protein
MFIAAQTGIFSDPGITLDILMLMMAIQGFHCPLVVYTRMVNQPKLLLNHYIPIRFCNSSLEMKGLIYVIFELPLLLQVNDNSTHKSSKLRYMIQ